jgi:predicted TIM-barrel fold metal-dependent hydrolase
MTKAVNDILGPNVLMYESDFPHPECKYPESTDTVLAWEPVIGAEAMTRLMYDNAASFFRMLSDPFEDGVSDGS